MTNRSQHEEVIRMLNDTSQLELPAETKARMQVHLDTLRLRLESDPVRRHLFARYLLWIVNRRRLQFTLRALLLAMFLVSIPVFVFIRPYLAQHDAARAIERLKGSVVMAPGGSQWLRERLGGGIRNVVQIDVADCDDPADYMRAVLRCPRLEVLVVGGERFTDRELLRLAELQHLRGLVLDTTSHSSQALARLKTALPNLVVRHSWRRAETALGDVASFETGTPPQSPSNNRYRPIYAPYGGPDWLRERTDNKYFKDLIFVYLNDKATDEDLEWLPLLRGYQALLLTGSRVTDRGLAKLRDWGSRQLMLDYRGFDCLFTRKGLAEMNSNPDARSNLMIYNVPLADNDLSFIHGQSGLEFLVLQQAGITDRQLPALVDLPLYELVLDHNPITDAGLEHVAAMKNLRTLSVHGTAVTSGGVEGLRRALPQCHVRWSRGSAN